MVRWVLGGPEAPGWIDPSACGAAEVCIGAGEGTPGELEGGG